MDKKIIRNIVKNFSSLIAAQFFSRLCSFAVYIIIARFLGVSGFGKLSFVVSFVALFGVVLDMGLSELFVRDVAGSSKETAKRYLNNIIALKIVLSGAAFLLILGISSISPQLKMLMPVILILTGAYIVELYTFLFRAIFRTYERMEIEAFTLICEGILKVSLLLILANTLNLTILLVAKIFIFSNIIILLLSIYIAKSKFMIPGLLFDFQFWKKLIKRALPFALLFFFGVINFKIDIMMVSCIMGDKFTGWYSAAVKLIEATLIIPISVAIAFFPAFSKSNKNSREALLPLFQQATKILLFIALPILIILNLAPKFILGSTFGSNFLKSVPVLRVLSWTLLPFFMKFLLDRFLLSLEISRIIFISYFVGTLLNIVLNFALSKPFGLLGISFATLISETSIIGCNFLYLKNRLRLIT